MRTLPSPSNVDVWFWRTLLMSGAADHVLLTGSYTSALAEFYDPPEYPAETKTLPPASNVAAW